MSNDYLYQNSVVWWIRFLLTYFVIRVESKSEILNMIFQKLYLFLQDSIVKAVSLNLELLTVFQDLVPISKEVNVPFDFHRYIIGQKGKDVRRLMDEYNVNISIPPQDQQSDLIKVTGPPANVQRAEDALAKKVQALELEKEDRILKSHELTVEVDPLYHPKLIGRRGEVINKLRAGYDVKIQLPDRNNENQGVITIIGYEKNCEEARDEILRMVKDFVSSIISRLIFFNIILLPCLN